MASRRLVLRDSAPVPHFNTHRKAQWEPRDEYVKLPSRLRPQPAPIDVAACQTQPTLKAALATQAASKLEDLESPKEPEIVDVAVPLTWPQRGTVSKHTPSSRGGTPSLYSRCSTRQSELSYGILDYYTRDCPSGHDHESLPPTPKIGPPLDGFEFELAPQTPTPTEAKPVQSAKPVESNTTAGARRPDKLVEYTYPGEPMKRPHIQHKKTYSLFPKTDQIPPQSIRPRALTLDRMSPTSTYSRAGGMSQISSHTPPRPSYQPRKKSLTPSVRSRQDSFTSYRSLSTRPMIPLCTVSSTSTASTDRSPSVASVSFSTTSPSPPEQKSRWSDDTIASPELTPAVYPLRTSIDSSLLSRGLSIDKDGTYSNQYPACFFEDDEHVPLRKKLAWKRSVSITEGRPWSLRRRSGNLKAQSRHSVTCSSRLKRILLCSGCGCSGRRRL